MHNEHYYRLAMLSGTSVPSPALVRTFDRLATESLNGDGGGYYVPEEAIVLGGSGGLIKGSTGGFVGGIETMYGTKKGILLGDNDWPQYETPRIVRVMIPIRDGAQHRESCTPGFGSATLAVGRYDAGTPGSLTIAKDAGANNNTVFINQHIPSWKLPVGATVLSMELNYRTGMIPASVPTPTNYVIGFYLRGLRHDGYTSTALSLGRGAAISFVPRWQALTQYSKSVSPNRMVVSIASRTDVIFQKNNNGLHTSGAVQPPGFATAVPGTIVSGDGGVSWLTIGLSGAGTPAANYDMQYYGINRAEHATPAAYFNSGLPQKITVFPNVNTILDSDTYAYSLQIQDFANTKNSYHSLVLTLSVPNMRPGA